MKNFNLNKQQIIQTLRIVIFLGIIFIVAYSIYDAVKYFITEPQTVDLKVFSEPRKIAVDVKIKGNSEWANRAVLLLGFLWVILLAEKSEFVKIKIKYPLEILLFITANVCFVFSLAAHFVWENRIVAAYWDIGVPKGEFTEVPDLLCKHMSELSNIQFIFFIAGISVTLLLLVFSRYTTNQYRCI